MELNNSKIINNFMIDKLIWLDNSNNLTYEDITFLFSQQLDELCKDLDVHGEYMQDLKYLFYSYVALNKENFYKYIFKKNDKAKFYNPNYTGVVYDSNMKEIDIKNDFTIYCINSWDMVLFIDNKTQKRHSMDIRKFEHNFEVIE